MQDIHVDSEGKEKTELASVPVEHGQDVKLTIDAKFLTALYEQFKEDKSCFAMMNPYIGETLAVSIQSYNNNDFIMGMPGE